ncbi:MAG: glutathione S-transferase family protein [Myxococcota bacterium]
MLTFYEHPLSPYARKLKILLYEKGIPFDCRFVNPYAGPEDPNWDAFLRASPRREVPVLVDGELAVFDSTIMADYIEERWPDPPTLPAGPAERARVRMLEELCDTELEAVNWGMMEILFFKRATGALADKLMGAARGQLARLFARLERELAGREWMNGAGFGRGDAAVYPHVTGAAGYGVAPSEACPRLRAWLARVAARPSVARESGELARFMSEMMAAAAGSGDGSPSLLQRQYRDHRLEWMMKSGGVEIVLAGLANGTIKFATGHGE